MLAKLQTLQLLEFIDCKFMEKFHNCYQTMVSSWLPNQHYQLVLVTKLTLADDRLSLEAISQTRDESETRGGPPPSHSRLFLLKERGHPYGRTAIRKARTAAAFQTIPVGNVESM